MSKYIKKADYIAKYGEEAWEIEAEKRREYQRQYAKEHKEEQKEYYKQWYQENKEHHSKKMKQWYQDNIEKCKEYGRQYHQEHKEEYNEYSKQYYQDNKERIAEYMKQYNDTNKERIAEQVKQYRSTQLGRANRIKINYLHYDKKRGFPTDQNIDEDWIIENIFGSSCIYCGESDWQKLGADRIDNTKGHTPDNCVCSCKKCNEKRGDRYTVEEFVLLKKKNLIETI